MTKRLFAVVFATLFAPMALSDELEVRIFESPSGALFAEKPELSPDRWEFGSWTVVSGPSGACASAWTTFYRGVEGPNVTVSTPDGMVHYLSGEGLHYTREQTERTWTLIGQGSWSTTKIAWVGEEAWFLLDPRERSPSHWYMQSDSTGCYGFREERRSRGPAGILTVVLGSGIDGLPAWTLTTGRAWIDAPGRVVETAGNWLD